ncbi:hypothetical protein H4R21_005946, partial [Coemansia helicoidea]
RCAGRRCLAPVRVGVVEVRLRRRDGHAEAARQRRRRPEPVCAGGAPGCPGTGQRPRARRAPGVARCGGRSRRAHAARRPEDRARCRQRLLLAARDAGPDGAGAHGRVAQARPATGGNRHDPGRRPQDRARQLGRNGHVAGRRYPGPLRRRRRVCPRRRRRVCPRRRRRVCPRRRRRAPPGGGSRLRAAHPQRRAVRALRGAGQGRLRIRRLGSSARVARLPALLAGGARGSHGRRRRQRGARRCDVAAEPRMGQRGCPAGGSAAAGAAPCRRRRRQQHAGHGQKGAPVAARRPGAGRPPSGLARRRKWPRSGAVGRPRHGPPRRQRGLRLRRGLVRPACQRRVEHGPGPCRCRRLCRHHLRPARRSGRRDTAHAPAAAGARRPRRRANRAAGTDTAAGRVHGCARRLHGGRSWRGRFRRHILHCAGPGRRRRRRAPVVQLVRNERQPAPGQAGVTRRMPPQHRLLPRSGTASLV